MMRLFKNFFARFTDDEDHRPMPVPPRVRPRPVARKPVTKPSAPLPDFDDENYTSDIGGRIADGGPGKNVLVRSKYVREDTGTHETLKIVDDSIFINDEELGADPYNTGRFDRSKTWDATRFRK